MEKASKRNKGYMMHLYLNKKQYRYLEEQSVCQQKFMTDIVIDMIEQARVKDGFEMRGEKECGKQY
jgi:hypothetical protein